jgi:hypothetical protein
MPTTTKHFGRQLIGPRNNPYMLRYILFRWANLPRVYVHKFLRSDEDRAPHNHPWWFVSLVLRGHYLEYTDKPPNPHVRKRFSLAYRPLSTFHRVDLPNGFRPDGSYGPMPCWTLVVTGPDVRSWGFRCPDPHVLAGRLIPWQEFDGCGE